MFSKIMCSSADVVLVTSPLANCTSNGVVGIPAFFFAVIEVATVVRRRQRHAIDSCSRASGASKKAHTFAILFWFCALGFVEPVFSM